MLTLLDKFAPTVSSVMNITSGHGDVVENQVDIYVLVIGSTAVRGVGLGPGS